jgi:hypothetical protein
MAYKKNVSLKTDANGRTLQSLTPYASAGVKNVSLSGTSASSTLPTDAFVVRIASTGDCHIVFDTSAPTATTNDMLFPAGVEVWTLDPAWTHFAVIQAAGSTGTVSITAMV